MKETDLAYLAGFLDGEGTISAIKRSRGKSFGVRVAVYNTEIRVLQRFERVFGCGRTSERGHWRYGRKRSFQWYLRDPEVVWVLKHLLPYLILKKEQAKLAMRLVNLPRFTRVKEKIRLGLRIRELNK